MDRSVSIVVMPRDRFSSLIDCVKAIIQNTKLPFTLYVLDYGQSKQELKLLHEMMLGRTLEIIPSAKAIPMAAFGNVLPKISSKYTAWVDNDTFVTPGWLEALIEQAEAGAKVLLPYTLEMEGLDVDRRNIPLRNHITHSELRKVTVDGKEYVFDHKPYRRAKPEELPKLAETVDFFELHTFFAETEVLRQLDYPDMVVREHIDLGIQLSKKGIEIWNSPKSIVHFDNINHRPSYRDLKFFFFRWAQDKIDKSHDLFEKRWGYRFYNERFLKNWASRRKVYSVCRFLFLPQKLSDLISRAWLKLFKPKIPLNLRANPLEASERVLPTSQRTNTLASQLV